MGRREEEVNHIQATQVGGIEEDKRLWLGLGCVITTGGVCVIALLIGIVIINWVNRKPETFVTVKVPAQAEADVPFAIELQIENLSARPQVLDSIEISPDYLAGIRIESSQPPFIGQADLPFSQDHAYQFDRTFQPNEILVVKFTAVGVQAGDFVGEIDVCVDGLIRCLSYGVRTVVE